MKLFIAALFFTQSLFAGLPPTTIKGQLETPKPTTFNFQVPNNQATTTSSVTRLIETGNNNLLVNPSFEHQTTTTGYTFGSGASGAFSLLPDEGLRSISVSFTGLAAGATLFEQIVTPSPSSLIREKNLEVSIWASQGYAGFEFCSVLDSVVQQCQEIFNIGTTTKKQIILNIAGGVSSTTVGFRVRRTSLVGSLTGSIFFDAAYVGLARNLGTVAQAQWVGSVKYVGATNCVWNIASATFANSANDPDCNTPTAAGSVTAPGTKIAAVVIPSLAPGTYRFVAKGTFLNGTAGAVCSFRFSDGTNNTISNRVGITSAAANAQMPMIEGEITYTSPQSNLTINIQAAESGTSSCQVSAPVATLGDLEISVYYFPTQSQTAVRFDQSNYDWTDTTPTFTAMGTQSGVKCQHSRAGQNLLYRCNYTIGGAPAASEARVSLPGSLVSASSTILPTLSIVGVQTGTNAGAQDVFVLIEPSVSYVTFGVQASGAAALNKRNGNALVSAGDTVSFFATIPIAGWQTNQNAPLLVGGVTSSSAGLTRVESFSFAGATNITVCSSTPCTLYRNNSVGITVSRSATGRYSLNFPSGMFSAAPVCTFSGANTAPNITFCGNFPTTPTATAYPIACTTPVGPADSDIYGDVICVGPR